MSTKTSTDLIEGAGGARSEPGGRAQRPAGGEPLELPEAIRDRLADEVIDELLAGARTEEEIVGPGGVLAQLTKRLVERAMSAELTEHLGYEPHQEPHGGAGNTRNGSTGKTLATEHGLVRIETPRDRNGGCSGSRRFRHSSVGLPVRRTSSSRRTRASRWVSGTSRTAASSLRATSRRSRRRLRSTTCATRSRHTPRTEGSRSRCSPR